MSRNVREMRPTFIDVPPDIARFGRVHQPSDAEAPILTGPVRAAVHRWLVELQCEEELKAVGLSPRRTGILAGPPGCGKTTLAHHLSARLGVALVEVNMQTIVGSHLGETGNNLQKLFSAANSRHQELVLFLDEIDAIGTKRQSDGTSCGNERNAMVIALMSMIDHYPGAVIAATNRAEDIDPALWRRFGLQLDIGLPDPDSRYAILARYLAPFSWDEDAVGLVCDLTNGATPALLRNLMEGIKRDLILQARFGGENTPEAVIGRVVAAIQPHAETARPPLWADTKVMQRLSGLPWPPTRGAA
ncbi:ATP-binding protein (plasmid) [Azospirillum sp. A26]|uniref:AAA family ATPase n=1 Tax=Azospirillum sp. A26 TaxID=3160607 RepID=UPI00367207E1